MDLLQEKTDQWTQIFGNFDQWTSPLRPASEDVALYAQALEPSDRTLLLGITPELIQFADTLIDHNAKAVELASCQNSKVHVIHGEWGDLPFESCFDAVIGDGCLNAFQGTLESFFAQVKKVLKPNGRLIMRVFIAPEEGEKVEDVLQQAKGNNFHAFKWRVAHALAHPYVSVQKMFDVIHPIWQHPTLDVYKGSSLIYYFPKLSELPQRKQIHYARSYELAERCPVITWQFH